MKFYNLLLITLFLAACGPNPDRATTEEAPPPPAREVVDENPKNDPQPLDDMIRVTNLEPGADITSPFVLRGEARGYWYFEGSFPVFLTGASGQLLAETYASPTAEWMTADFVPFTVELRFDAPAGTPAAIELMLDNPAGPDEGRERSLIFPVTLR